MHTNLALVLQRCPNFGSASSIGAELLPLSKREAEAVGVAVRTGHHCCQPLMARFGMTGTVRASFALYNTQKDVEALAEATRKAVSMLS